VNVSTSGMFIVVAVVGARFVIPLFIPRFPLPAILLALVLDAADQTILDTFTEANLDGYQSYDKALDIFYLTIAYLAVIRNWTNGFAVDIARFLWYFRLIGVFAFEQTELRWILFVFPNVFEYFFIAYEAVNVRWDPRRLTRRILIGMTAFIWVFIKLPQEWWIHIAQNDFTDFMRETVFGVETTATWSEAVTNRPAVTAALIGAACLLVFAGWRVSRHLPDADWPARFAVEPMWTAPSLDPGVDEYQPAMRWPMFEKVVLVALVSSIFASMLDVGAAGYQIVVATVIVVGAGALLSWVLTRRQITWKNSFVELIAVAALNTALISGYAAWVGSGTFNLTLGLFFGGLLAVILVLFDHFSIARQQHGAAVGVAAVV